MHLRRIACFLLGGWLVGSALMLFITSWNYDAASDVFRSPSPEMAKMLAELPGEEARMLLFHMANEASRSYGTAWGITQLVMGFSTAVALFLERRTRFYSAGIGLMLLLVLFECFVILPQLEWVGRSVDFVSWKVYSSARDQYWNLRAVFLGIESVKLLVGAGVTVALLVARSRSRSIRPEDEESGAGEAPPSRPATSRVRIRKSGEHAARS
ncbi:MAG: hypothetical protein ACR2NN_18380 [Bryobacteraceae bacterium]